MTDYYIAKAGETHGEQKYANVSLAPDGKTYEQAVFSSDPWRWASTYNSPKDAFDTIIYRQLKSASVGDIVTLKIYKGYIPDLGTTDQPTLADRNLDAANFLASKSVTMTDTAATDYVFKFDQEFSDSNLTSQLAGDAPQFTVLQETTNSGGTVISAHRTLFAVRTVVPTIFTFPEDYGPDTNSGNGGAGNTHGASNGTFFGNSGSAVDRPLALEFLKSTDIPLGNDSNNGLTVSTPKATMSSLQGAHNFTIEDKVFFRAGTYGTELEFHPVSETDVYMEFDTHTEHVSLEGYQDETVSFETPTNIDRFVQFANMRPPTVPAGSKYTVKNIQFRNGAGDALQSFLSTTESSSSPYLFEFLVENCTFTQLSTDTDVAQGALHFVASNRATTIARNCTFNVADTKCIFGASSIICKVENNVFNILSPATNDNRLAAIAFSGRSNPVESLKSKLFFTGNEINYTFSDGMNGDTIVIQPEYFNEFHILGNTFNFETTDIQSNRIIDTIRPATTTTNSRQTDIINIIGNIFNNNTGRGDTIEFYRSPTQLEHTHVVNLNYNHFIGNDEMKNNNYNQVFDSTNMKATEFNCIGNIFESYQDFLLLNDMQNTPFLVEDNIFKHGGNNNNSNGGELFPVSIYVYESDGGIIRNNTFFIEEEGTCIQLEAGDSANGTMTGNSFVYLGAPRTDGETYKIYYIATDDLSDIYINNNYYYGLDKLGDSTMFFTGGVDLAPLSLTDADVAYHTTNIIKRDVAKSMTSRLTKEVGWKV